MKANMFDRLVGLVLHAKKEAEPIKNLLPYLGSVKLFNFDTPIGVHCVDGDTPNDLQVQATIDRPTDLTQLKPDQLSLPFPVTALVFPDAVSVFIPVATSKEKAALTNTYLYVSVIKIRLDEELDIEVAQVGMIAGDAKRLSAGTLGGVANLQYIIKPNSNKMQLDMQLGKELGHWLVSLTFLQLAKINTLDRFILEVSSTKNTVKSAKYIPKAHQRPHYIVLRPEEIRKYMRTEHEAVGTRAGHERRAHLRQYPDDPIRFPKAHGRIVKIPAVWVGSTEVIVGETQYKVILD